MPLRNLPRYIQALVGLMFLSAVIHMIVLIIYCIKTGDGTPFNFFSIVGADLFFPILTQGNYAMMYSSITMMVLYGVIYLFFTHENRRPR